MAERSVVLRAGPGASGLTELARAAAVTGEFLSREQLTTAAAPHHVAAVEEYAPPYPPTNSPTIGHLRFGS